MSKSDELYRDILTTHRDQARASIAEFVRRHTTPDGNPDAEMLSLIEQFNDASHGTDDTTALWGILAAYGLLTGILESLETYEDKP